MLSLCNWFLEGYKWNILLKDKAVKSQILLGFVRGLALIMFSPSRQGQLLGRLSTITSKNWKSSFYAYTLSASVQLAITMFFGAAFVFFNPNKETVWIGYLALSFCVIYGLALIKFRRFLSRFTSNKQLRQLVLISACRYLLFIASYVYILGDGAYSITQICGVISLFFVLNALTPIGILGELGKRELTLAGLFILFFGDEGASVNASLCIWGFNVLVPAIIGCFAWLIPSQK